MENTADKIMEKYLFEKIDKDFPALLELADLTKKFLQDAGRLFSSKKYEVSVDSSSHPLFLSYDSESEPENHNRFVIYSTMDQNGKVMKKHRFFNPKNAAIYVSEVRMFPANSDFDKTVYNNFHTGVYYPTSKRLNIAGDIFNGENAEIMAKEVMPAYKKFLNDMLVFIKKNI